MLPNSDEYRNIDAHVNVDSVVVVLCCHVRITLLLIVFMSFASYPQVIFIILVCTVLVVWFTLYIINVRSVTTQNGAEKKKHPVNGSSVGANALLMREFRENGHSGSN